MDRPRYIERPENPELSPSEIHARASEELRQQFDDMERYIKDGNVDESKPWAEADAWRLIDCVTHYADYAVTHQDEETVARCVELTKFFPSQVSKADIYHSGLLVGNFESSQALHEALVTEMQTSESRMLDRVVARSIDRGIDPTAWIQRYSGRLQQELDLTLRAQRCMSQSDSFSEEERNMHHVVYEETLGRLYSEGTCGASAKLLARELPEIEDSARRRELVNRHLAVFMEMSEINWELYESHLTIAKSTVENPSVSSSEEAEQFVENIQLFSDTIENIGVAFREIRSDFDVTTAQLPWLLALKQYSDYPSPQELIEYLDIQIGAMINAVPLDEEKVCVDSTTSEILRDKLLSGIAKQYAQKGDFESSAKVVGNIADERICARTLQQSLSQATELSQIEEMSANELLFMFHPHLKLYIDAAAASSTGDVAAAVELCTGLLQDDDLPIARSAFLHELYLDLGEDLRFAKQILAIEREMQKPSSRDDIFIRDLIRGGDQQEPYNAYTEVIAHQDPSYRFNSLIYLLQDIEAQGD